MQAVQLPPSPIAGLRTVELGPGDQARLQVFFDQNPAYFVAVNGEPAAADEAHKEMQDQPPADWPFTKKWQIGYQDDTGDLAALAIVITDLLAAGVWHISLFILATARHGSGDARTLHHGLQSWAHANGAEWLRLGVVQGNARAERFWESMGYLQTRTRAGVQMGQRSNTLRVMVKPLDGGSIQEYLALVPRDRPERPGAR